MRYHTLVFDFDGTIADTLGETRRIYNRMAPDYGLRQVEEHELESLRHLSLKQLLEHLEIPKRRVPILLSRGTGMMRGNLHQLDLIDGMREVLPKLREKAMGFGVLTSNIPANVDAFLRSHGMRESFDFISSTSKLTGKSKHLKAIRKTFSLRPEQILYIGDEIRDIRASRKAGIPVAAVTWGFNSRESLALESPDYLIDHPDDFLTELGIP
jgi:phosphoglycolate phosphatase-like HAD superfamily hydrolase